MFSSIARNQTTPEVRTIAPDKRAALLAKKVIKLAQKSTILRCYVKNLIFSSKRTNFSMLCFGEHVGVLIGTRPACCSDKSIRFYHAPVLNDDEMTLLRD